MRIFIDDKTPQFYGTIENCNLSRLSETYISRAS